MENQNSKPKCSRCGALYPFAVVNSQGEKIDELCGDCIREKSIFNLTRILPVPPWGGGGGGFFQLKIKYLLINV